MNYIYFIKKINIYLYKQDVQIKQYKQILK